MLATVKNRLSVINSKRKEKNNNFSKIIYVPKSSSFTVWTTWTRNKIHARVLEKSVLYYTYLSRKTVAKLLIFVWYSLSISAVTDSRLKYNCCFIQSLWLLRVRVTCIRERSKLILEYEFARVSSPMYRTLRERYCNPWTSSSSVSSDHSRNFSRTIFRVFG